MIELSPSYRIMYDSRLPGYDTSATRAYQAVEAEQLPGQGSGKLATAFLYQPGHSLPIEHLRMLRGFESPGMVKLLDYGIANREDGPGRDFALIVEPLGEQVVGNLNQPFEPFSDEKIASMIIRPILPALRELEGRRTAHRAIRPNNLFWADPGKSAAILGPAVTSPPGQDQPSYLEPLESAMCDPRARGIGTFADDLFSLGVTLLMLSTGRNPLKTDTESVVTMRRLEETSYVGLAGSFRLSTSMGELIRGLLVDSPRERWNLRDLGQWAGIDGRRPKPPRVVAPKLAGRPIKIGSDEALTARSLALAITRNWDHGSKLLTSEEFQTWIRRSLAEEAVVDRITKVTRGTSETTVRERADRLTLVSIVALDPHGPMRYRSVTALLEGIPNLLGGALAEDDRAGEIVTDLTQMISAGLWSGWMAGQSGLSQEATRVRGLLERQRTVATTREPGQGIERCLYELNAEIACLSPLVIDSCVVELVDLLPALERLPREAFTEDFLTDRHILAFLTARSSKITDMMLRQAVGRKSALQRLVHQVRMLALVQSTSKQLAPGLTRNLAALLKDTAEAEIHGSNLKEMVLKDLEAAGPGGRIDLLLKTLEESGALETDRRGFEAARAEYGEGQKKLAELRDVHTKAQKRASALGPQIAGLVGLASGLMAIALMALMGVGL
jgi:hypothetical protein